MYELLLWLAAIFATTASAPKQVYADAPQTDYIGMVAAEAAYSAALPGSAPVKPKKPIDPSCKTCKGTGKVPSGDDLGWSPCPTCQAEDMPRESQSSSAVPPVQKPNRLPFQAR